MNFPVSGHKRCTVRDVCVCVCVSVCVCVCVCVHVIIVIQYHVEISTIVTVESKRCFYLHWKNWKGNVSYCQAKNVLEVVEEERSTDRRSSMVRGIEMNREEKEVIGFHR